MIAAGVGLKPKVDCCRGRGPQARGGGEGRGGEEKMSRHALITIVASLTSAASPAFAAWRVNRRLCPTTATV